MGLGAPNRINFIDNPSPYSVFEEIFSKEYINSYKDFKEPIHSPLN